MKGIWNLEQPPNVSRSVGRSGSPQGAGAGSAARACRSARSGLRRHRQPSRLRSARSPRPRLLNFRRLVHGWMKTDFSDENLISNHLAFFQIHDNLGYVVCKKMCFSKYLISIRFLGSLTYSLKLVSLLIYTY